MGKIAFVFAGQGAQYQGMGKSIYEASPQARAAMDAAEAIRPGTLRQCFEGDLSELSQTINTQPCLFLTDYACALAAREAGFEPQMCAGFSLGELAAAAFSGMISLEDAFLLVIKRAEHMQRAAEANPGRMAAVLRLTADQVVELAGQFERVYPVNFNCPGQTVVASADESFEPFCRKVAELRGRAVPLNVSGAFHSPFMAEASEAFRADVEAVELGDCQIPLYANLTAQPYAGDRKQLLIDQIKSPVRWQQTILNMIAAGATAFIEVGAGSTLSGLIRKTSADVLAMNVQDREGLGALRAARQEGKL